MHLPGLTPYLDGWELQRQIHHEVATGERQPTIIMLEHESTYTAGRRTHRDEFPKDGTPVIEVDRGGKITWHGPGQLVAYPIMPLRQPLDVIEYLRRLEAAVIAVCAQVGVVAGRVEGRSGVWVSPQAGTGYGKVAGQSANGRLWEGFIEAGTPPYLGDPAPATSDANAEMRKVCAVGARVARGVTMHGLALNCDPDLTAFDHIVPCGITDADVTSLTIETGTELTVTQMRPQLAQALVAALTPQLADSDTFWSHRRCANQQRFG